MCAKGSTCCSRGQARWESDLAAYFSVRLIGSSAQCRGKFAVRRKSAELSSSGEREEVEAAFSVAVLTYTR